MQSDDLDNKIRDAADHHHPAYDEQAWMKMEKLLNRHLPEKKDDRRRFLLFFLLLLLGGGAGWLLVAKPWNGTKQVAVNSQATSPVIPEKVNTKTTRSNSDNPDNENPAGVIKDNGTASIVTPPVEATDIPKDENAVPGSAVSKTVPAKPGKAVTGNKSDQIKPASNKIQALTASKELVTPAKKQVVTSGNDQVVSKNPPQDLLSFTKPGNDALSKALIPEKSTEASNSTINPVISAAQKAADNNKVADVVASTDKTSSVNKSKIKKTNSFFFSLSAGPDMSAASSDKLGQTRLLAGVGLGYTFHDRVTIRTGLYSGRKIYSAQPAEYHAPADFYTYYPYLQKVDADCKVFEIPLNVSYNFGRTARQNWFASTGLSSYIMKKETYNYFYKVSPAAATQSHKYSIEDQNKHILSVLTLSGGYQRNIGKSVTLTAEPYAKIPLVGVGYGKVKLNSMGMLFTVGIKPFGSKKKP